MGRAQLELTQVRQEIERRIAEKEEEFLSTKKNFQKAVDGMQGALETESKGKAEAIRMKKKLESDVSELETALEHANASNQDTQKAIKKYHQQIRESQTKLEDEQRTKEVVRDNLLSNERRANSAQNALEEARTLLEQADRSRRMTEQELSDTNEQLSDLTCTNQAIAGAKRKLESEMQTLHSDLDEMANEAALSDDKAKKAMVDAARLADELRSEQEIALSFEKDRKLLDCQLKDMHGRLDEAETNALKGGKKAMNKMETRIRELESEVDAENRRFADSTKNLANLREELKNWLMLLMRTERIMNACKDWLINFKPRSKLTRSKLKRQKKLLLSIWPSSAKLKDILLMLKSVLTLMNKPLPRLRQRDVLDPLFLCKEQEIHHLIKTCSPMLQMAL